MSSKKADARERVKAMREEQARQERKRERMTRFGIVGALIVAVVIVGAAVIFTRGGDDTPTALPATVSGSGGGIVVEPADSDVTIDVWMDFLCPHCKEFEDLNGSTLSELGESGQASVVYHPLTFTGGTYSARANNAFACAANEGNAAEFATAAFASPQQWSDDALIALGESAAIGGDYESCVNADTYDAWVTDVAKRAQEEQIQATPTVFVNGEELPSTSWSPEGIRAAVEAVAGGGTVSDAATPAPATTE